MDIPAHTSANVSDYSNSGEGAQIDLTYAMPDGTQIALQGRVPFDGSNSTTVTSSTTDFTATGYHPTLNYAIYNA